MSKSYTVTLNDNVVSKLQSIVGGGNSLVTKSEVIQAISDDSRINVNNFISFVQSKSDNYENMTSIDIQGIISVRGGYGASVFGLDEVTYSGSVQDILSNELLAIEEISFNQTTYSNININITLDNSGPSSTGEYLYEIDHNYILLVLHCELLNGNKEDYPITLDDVLTFIDANA